MTDVILERANQIKERLDNLNELKNEFEAPYITVNNVRTVEMAKDILEGWREINIEYLDECIKELEKEFKKL